MMQATYSIDTYYLDELCNLYLIRNTIMIIEKECVCMCVYRPLAGARGVVQWISAHDSGD